MEIQGFLTKKGKRAITLTNDNGLKLYGYVNSNGMVELANKDSASNWKDIDGGLEHWTPNIDQLAHDLIQLHQNIEMDKAKAIEDAKIKEKNRLEDLRRWIDSVFKEREEFGSISLRDFFAEEDEPEFNAENVEIMEMIGTEFCFSSHNPHTSRNQYSTDYYGFFEFKTAQERFRDNLTNDNDLFYFSSALESEQEELLDIIKECETLDDVRDLLEKFDEKEDGYYDGNGSLYISEEDLNNPYFSSYSNDGKTRYIKPVFKFEFPEIEETEE